MLCAYQRMLYAHHYQVAAVRVQAGENSQLGGG